MFNIDSVNSFFDHILNPKALIGLGTGAAVISASGIAPKVGLGRAVVLAFRTAFSSQSIQSARTSEIQNLLKQVNKLSHDRYIVVTGGKGMGKSTLIKSALNRHLGVVEISVSSQKKF